MTYRVRNIVIAVVLAALAALMTSFYVTNYKRNVQQDESDVKVWVAARDIPANTPGSDAVKQLDTKQVERRNVVPGAISSTDQVNELVSSQPIYAGEQITARRFTTRTQIGVHGKLKGNLRAFQVQGNGDQLLAGTIRTGDHVDLLATFKYKQGESAATYVATRTVLRDVEVLRAPDGPAPGAKLSSGLDSKYSVMLAVTDAQANKLWFTATVANGNNQGAVLGWSLDLRPVLDDTDSPEGVETIGSILRDGLRPAQVKQLLGDFGGQ
jgi:pilus assembly protein CpaB